MRTHIFMAITAPALLLAWHPTDVAARLAQLTGSS